MIPWNKGIKSGSINMSQKQIKERNKKIKYALIGKPHKRWHTGGYIYLCNWPECWKRCLLQHQVVVTKYINRRLCETWVIHHINHIPYDNNPQNLYIFITTGRHVVFEGDYRKFPELNKLTSNLDEFKMNWLGLYDEIEFYMLSLYNSSEEIEKKLTEKKTI